MQSQYSPFDKDIDDLKSEDLSELRSVSEGWYVEYKRELTCTKAMAKSLSAFANTNGGWLFVGIDEAKNGEPVAGDFVGLPQNSIDDLLQKLRQSVSSLLNPTPYFRTKVIPGPCSKLNLGRDSSILIVQIPRSLTTPHVHKDGRIYRRVADGSEPKPETDRFVLDQLRRRGSGVKKSVKQSVKKWVKRDPEFSKQEAKTPYLRCLLCVDPWQQKSSQINTSRSDVRNVFESNETGTVSIPFESIYSSSNEIIARQLGSNSAENLGLTWKFRSDSSSDIVLPLTLYDGVNPNTLVQKLDEYNHIEKFAKLLQSQEPSYSSLRVVDLNMLLPALLAVASKYRRLLALVSDDLAFYCKVRLLNCWRIIPYIDVTQVLEQYEKHGMPMVMESELTAPKGHHPDSFAYIASPDFFINLQAIMLQGITMFVEVAVALGLPILPSEISEDECVQLYNNYFDAGDRARHLYENSVKN